MTYEEIMARLKDGLEVKPEEFAKATEELVKAAVTDVSTKKDTEHAEEIAKLQAGPKRLATLRAAGVDVDALAENPAILEVLEAQFPKEGKDFDDEWAKGMIEKYRLPVSAGGGASEETNASHFVEGARKLGGSEPAKTTITIEEFATWDPRDRMAFMEYLDVNGLKNVEDALSRGEPAVGVSFTPLHKRVAVAGGVNWGPRSYPQE